MEIREEEIYTPNHANSPDVDENQLPKGVPSEAAYILEQAVSGRNLDDIAEDLEIAPNTVGASLKNMREKGIVNYPDKRRGREYEPTESGEIILDMLEGPERNPERREEVSLENLGREMVFGDGSYSAREEIEVLVYTLHEDYTISDLETEIDLRSEELLEIRDSLDPLMTEKGHYTVEYEPSLLGVQVLAHLDAVNFWQARNNVDGDEVNLDKEDLEWTDLS